MSKIKTLFQEMDNVLNSNEGNLIALGSRPYMGKTTFVTNLAKNIAELNDTQILFFSLENSKEKLKYILFQKLKLSLNDLSKIHIDETHMPGMDYIEETISQFDNLSVVIIDNLEGIDSYNTGFKKEILNSLKNICKNKNVNILYTCHTKRKPDEYIDKHPDLDDFNEDIVINTDVIFVLHRARFYDDYNNSIPLRLMRMDYNVPYLIPLLYDENSLAIYENPSHFINSAPNTRVELHVNTKKSDSISTIGVGDAFEFAKNYNLKAVAFANLNNVEDFPEIAKINKQYKSIKAIYGMHVYLEENHSGAFSMTLLAKNPEGIKELFKIIPNMFKFGNTKVVDKKHIEANRQNLLCGATGDNSRLFDAICSKRPIKEITSIAQQYDYFEIFPTYNSHIRQIFKEIVELGNELGIPVIATGNCNCCYLDEETSHDVIKAARGYRYYDEPMDFLSTEDMLNEFAYLGEEAAYKTVVENTNLLADMIENISPVSEDTIEFTLPDADNIISSIATERAKSLYGDRLPEEISDRMQNELNIILNGNFSSRYLIAHYLTEYARQKNYPVSTMGTVGSSLIAFLLGITEINPLKPHYVCNECKYTEFAKEKVYTSYDLPDKKCPVCGFDLSTDGHDIPYQSFMGLNGEKTPTFSLNFPQSARIDILNYLCSIVGKENLAFAKSIYGITEPKADRYIATYNETQKNNLSISEKTGIICNIKGVKCEEKMHPSGVIFIPEKENLTPLENYKVEDCSINKITHYDHNDLRNITKFNILGYNPLELLSLAEKYTGISRNDINLKSPELISLFQNSNILGTNSSNPATLGIPEFEVKIVRLILETIKPDSIGELMKISSVMHGTNTWFNNAETLISEGDITINDIAATTDDVFNDLVSFGVEEAYAYYISDAVRRGLYAKGKISEEKLNEYLTVLENSDTPKWYINSILKVFYMHSKSHTVEYVRIALMLAWYKLYYPTEFYAAYLEVYRKDEKYNFLPLGIDGINMHLERIKDILGKDDKYIAEAENLSIFKECFQRGIKFVFKKDERLSKYIPANDNTIIINLNKKVI